VSGSVLKRKIMDYAAQVADGKVSCELRGCPRCRARPARLWRNGVRVRVGATSPSKSPFILRTHTMGNSRHRNLHRINKSYQGMTSKASSTP